MKVLKTYPCSDFLSLVLFTIIFTFVQQPLKSQDGKTLFKQNCGVCHATTQQKLVGPGLEGITGKRSEEWLIKWIKDSQALIKSGDADAKKAFDDAGQVAMPPFAMLSDADIKAILAYVGNPEPVKSAEVTPAASVSVVEKSQPVSTEVKIFIFCLLALAAGVIVYIVNMRKKLRAMGYALDSEPLRDRIGEWTKNNSSLLLIVVVALIILVMKSCIQGIM